jgi:hypothetical protein
MSFRPRGMYTRDEIHDKLGGGSKQSYLPNRGGVVMCACLRADTNPGAPSIILPGNGPEIMRSAEMLCSQKGAAFSAGTPSGVPAPSASTTSFVPLPRLVFPTSAPPFSR